MKIEIGKENLNQGNGQPMRMNTVHLIPVFSSHYKR